MKTILLVDDSKLSRLWTSAMLGEEKYKLIEAEDGQRGIERIQTDKPDCVILDLLMPKKTGVQILAELSDSGSSVPVVVMTSDIQESVRKQCLDLGARAFLNKPPQTTELVSTLDGILADVNDLEIESLVRAGVDDAAEALRQIIHIDVSVCDTKITQKPSDPEEPLFAALSFKGDLAGTSILSLGRAGCVEMVQAITGMDVEEEGFSAMVEETIVEIANVMLNRVVGSFAQALGGAVHYRVPKYLESGPQDVEDATGLDSAQAILASTGFGTPDFEVEGGIALYFTKIPDRLDGNVAAGGND